LEIKNVVERLFHPVEDSLPDPVRWLAQLLSENAKAVVVPREQREQFASVVAYQTLRTPRHRRVLMAIRHVFPSESCGMRYLRRNTSGTHCLWKLDGKADERIIMPRKMRPKKRRALHVSGPHGFFLVPPCKPRLPSDKPGDRKGEKQGFKPRWIWLFGSSVICRSSANFSLSL